MATRRSIDIDETSELDDEQTATVDPAKPFADGETLFVRGEGGFVTRMDVPKEGTAQREVWDYLFAKGVARVVPLEQVPDDVDDPPVS